MTCHYPHLGGSILANPKGIVSSSPRLRGTSYLGKTGASGANPHGVAASDGDGQATTPFGVGEIRPAFTQGSSCLATLGFGPEFLWDSFAKVDEP